MELEKFDDLKVSNVINVKVKLQQDIVDVFECFAKTSTSRNQPKCNQSIYDYMRLAVVCD